MRAILSLVFLVACSPSPDDALFGANTVEATGGQPQQVASTTGGSPGTGGADVAPSTGGQPAYPDAGHDALTSTDGAPTVDAGSGGASTGGTTSTGGTLATGGIVNTGGTTSTGGAVQDAAPDAKPVTCGFGWKDCNGACVQTSEAETGCGGPTCDPCPTVDRATAICRGGVCDILCADGYSFFHGKCVQQCTSVSQCTNWCPTESMYAKNSSATERCCATLCGCRESQLATCM